MKDSKKIRNILVFVEFEDRKVRQVLASKEAKEICLNLLKDDDGVLKVTEELMPIQVDQ